MKYDDFLIFNNKTYSDLLKDIYENQTDKADKIKLLIQQLQPLISTVDEAILLVPVVSNYLDISVKNDLLLIKLANSIQKIVDTSLKEKLLAGGAPGIMSPLAYDRLLTLANKDIKELSLSDKQITLLLEVALNMYKLTIVVKQLDN